MVGKFDFGMMYRLEKLHFYKLFLGYNLCRNKNRIMWGKWGGGWKVLQVGG